MTERSSCARLNLANIKNARHIKYIILCPRAVWLVWAHGVENATDSEMFLKEPTI